MSYDLSAAENIGLGDMAGIDDDARIRAAVGRAGIHQTLESLPRGYGTLLSRLFAPDPGAGSDNHDPGTGVLLSGGQWQRLALVRAFRDCGGIGPAPPAC